MRDSLLNRVSRKISWIKLGELVDKLKKSTKVSHKTSKERITTVSTMWFRLDHRFDSIPAKNTIINIISKAQIILQF